MKHTILTASILFASLLGANVYAQSAKPGEDRAVTSAPATKAEKAEAKAARKAEGKKVAKTASVADDVPASAGTAKVATKAERKEAAAKRKEAGAQASKGAHDQSGPSSN